MSPSEEILAGTQSFGSPLTPEGSDVEFGEGKEWYLLLVCNRKRPFELCLLAFIADVDGNSLYGRYMNGNYPMFATRHCPPELALPLSKHVTVAVAEAGHQSDDLDRFVVSWHDALQLKDGKPWRKEITFSACSPHFVKAILTAYEMAVERNLIFRPEPPNLDFFLGVEV